MSTLKHILVVVGTRPEAIKLAPVILTLKKLKNIRLTVLATAQHREMLDQVFSCFGISADVDFNVMQKNQSLSQLTARLHLAFAELLQDMKPDMVIAQGDTTTVLVAGMEAFYHAIPFLHVEAGLRSGDFRQPFPEEFNRVAVSKIAACHFSPTQAAAENLIREHVDPSRVHVTGNTVIDALLRVADQPYEGDINLPQTPYVLVTVHRRENFGLPLTRIIEAVSIMLDRFKNLSVFWPVHPNPNIQAACECAFSNHQRVILSKALDYQDMVYVLKNCRFVMTDSGGIQEEAPALAKPVLILRNTTERPEAIAAGVAKLVGADPEMILNSASRLLDDDSYFSAMAKGASPYGDGNASERIVNIIKNSL